MSVRKMYVESNQIVLVTTRGWKYTVPIGVPVTSHFKNRDGKSSVVTVRRIDPSGKYLWVSSPARSQERPVSANRAIVYAARVTTVPEVPPARQDGRVYISPATASDLVQRLDRIEAAVMRLCAMWEDKDVRPSELAPLNGAHR